MKYKNQVIHLIIFQAGWWSCVLSLRFDAELYALCLGAALAGIQVTLNDQRKKDIFFTSIALIMGIIFDSMIQGYLGFDFFGWSIKALSPFWLWMIWILFALSLRGSIQIVGHVSTLNLALMGFVFGPLSYVAGAKAGAAQITSSNGQLLVLGILWAIMMPLLVWFAKKIGD